MKFGFIKHRLLNESAEDMELGSSSEESVDLDYDDDSNDDSDEELFSSDEDALKDFGLDPEKYGTDSKKDEESEEVVSPGEESEKEGAGQATDEKSLLAIVNELGAIHNNEPISVASRDELKNLIQMGKDYTQKTQSLSEERKVFDSERSAASEEFNKAIAEFNGQVEQYSKQHEELQAWIFTIDNLKMNQPDLFEEVQRAYQQTQNQYKNPIVEQQLKAIQKELAETKKGLSVREDKAIIGEFERELAALAPVEQSLKELGISIDREAVKKQWAKTGMPVEEVIGSLYFKQMAQAQASKAKVEAVKIKTAPKVPSTVGKSRPGNKTPAINQNVSLRDYATQLANKYK